MTDDPRHYSPSYERNHEPIAQVLGQLDLEGKRILEVGSGSGQHVCTFARSVLGADDSPYTWQPTEQIENLESIRAWREHEGVQAQVLEPQAIDLLDKDWATGLSTGYAMAMSINVVHIVAWEGVLHMIEGAAKSLGERGVFYLYGPFKSRTRELEPSNASFDLWLKERFEGGGLREQEEIEEVARAVGLVLEQDVTMPANNRSLIFRKT